MQSNDETSESASNERDNARVRLARQIGRLLANEWLRSRTAKSFDDASVDSRRNDEQARSPSISPGVSP